MKRLENKVAIITGAASGLGRVLTLAFYTAGAKIVAADTDQMGLEQLLEEVNSNRLTTVQANITIPGDIDLIIRTAVDTYGTVDILINNGGTIDDFCQNCDVTDQFCQQVMDINFNGPFRAIRSVLKIMQPRKQGVIVNIASIGELNSSRALAAHAASKHAIIELTKNTGCMYAKLGIRCTAITREQEDQTNRTPINLSNTRRLTRNLISPKVSANRGSTPAEVAKVALFIASEEANFLNGAAIIPMGNGRFTEHLS